MKNKNTVTLVKPLEPSIEAYRKLGFTFKRDVNPDFIVATLPKGWHAEKRNDNAVYTTILFDSKNRVRAHSYEVIPSFLDIFRPHTELFCKYTIRPICLKGLYGYDRYEYAVLENSPAAEYETDPMYSEKLFSGGKPKCIFTFDEQTNRYYTEDHAIEKCVNFMRLNFPDWQNPEAYWD